MNWISSPVATSKVANPLDDWPMSRLPSPLKTTRVAETGSIFRVSLPAATSQSRIVPSSPHDTNCLPSGAKSMESIFPPWPLQVWNSFAVAKSQTWIGPVPLPAAMRLAFGDRDAQTVVLARKDLSILPSAMFQTLAWPSSHVVTADCRSGKKATKLTGSDESLVISLVLPLLVFHKHKDPSRWPIRTYSPPCENERAQLPV